MIKARNAKYQGNTIVKGRTMKGVKTICVAVAFALTGCSMTSPMLKPDVATPAAWNEGASTGSAAVSPDWWNAFGSSELQGLVQQALAGSPDLAIATERVRQAEAQVKIAGASLFPSLDIGAGSSTRTTSNDRGSVTTNASSATLSASYEIDLWGRNRAGVNAAKSSLQATEYDRDAAQLTLVAGVATSYFEVLSLRSRLEVARENLSIAQRVRDLVAARVKNGANTQLDLERQEATVLTQQAALLPLEQQERQTLAALAVLIGKVPEGFDVKATGISDLRVPAIEAGLPSELLVRRPDLASAEAQLAASNADLTAARAAMLPSISLTGSLGAASSALLSFVSGGTSTIGLALTVLQPIFDGGRLRGQKAVAESRERELAESYRKVILAAFKDVEDSLVAASRQSQQEALQTQVQAKAAEALRLAEVRYRAGADDLLSVLDAQRTLFSAQDQLSQIRLNRLESAVSLYKALGGGWSAQSAVALAQKK